MNLHDSAVVVVVCLRREYGFCLCPSGDRVSWLPWLVLMHDSPFLLNVFATGLLELPEPDGLE